MLDLLLSPATLVLVLLVFGIAPGLVLRLIVLAFTADDPRREELRAELYAVPRYERPLWVAEQIEIAISEGLWVAYGPQADGLSIAGICDPASSPTKSFPRPSGSPVLR